MNLDRQRLCQALGLLGAYLEDEESPIHLVAIGGSGLLLLNVIHRATQDLDVIALETEQGYVRADKLPPKLLEARQVVADQLGLDPGWLNAAPRSLLNPSLPNQGLPEGFRSRVVVHPFGALTLSLASRFDQICFKLHAAVDRGDPEGKHAQDLHSLRPTPAEWIQAARWTVIQDPSEGFRSLLLQALRALGVDGGDIDLL